jgi:signal transduction histidine kinase
MWGLALAVYRNNKKEFQNKTFALSIVFMGFWMLSGFSEKIINPPNNTFTLWTFRWAYAAGILSAVFFFLFATSLYLDHKPLNRVIYPALLVGIGMTGLSLSPFVITSASYQGGVLKSQNGPLATTAITVIVTAGALSIYLMYEKWHKSTGIDRARTSVMLGSIVLFFPIAVLTAVVIPAIVGNDLSTNYAYLAGLIPVSLTSYAIIRLRLLDVRIILRRTSVFVLGTVVLISPIVLLYVVFRVIHLNTWATDGLILLTFMVIVFYAPKVWRYIRRLSARLFFSELYDELQLLDVVSSGLASPANLKAGVLSALSEIVFPLGLESVGIIIPPGVINDNSWSFECSTSDNGNGQLSETIDEHYRFSGWLNNVSQTVITEELLRWPREAGDRALGEGLQASRLSACTPIMVLSAKVGYIVLGEKATNKAVSSTDIDFLEKAAERFGLFIDNYALSTKLGTQLNELQQVYSDLHEAYKFKSEIIQVTSHEFRTPITLVSGFALTLKEGWNQLVEEEKLSFLDNIVEACDRITNLTDQFFRVSSFEEGKISIEKMPVKLNKVIQRLCSSILPEEQERLLFEADPDMYVFTDPDHLHVILKNLLDNALRFSPADQSVVMRVWRNSFHDYIQIQDFGNGIPSEEMERIFEPFVRLESLAHHSRGMGLGLYIVRLLSSKLGIEVEIDCADGKGTTVTLSVPL